MGEEESGESLKDRTEDRKRVANSARFYIKSINMRIKKLPLRLMIGSLW